MQLQFSLILIYFIILTLYLKDTLPQGSKIAKKKSEGVRFC